MIKHIIIVSVIILASINAHADGDLIVDGGISIGLGTAPAWHKLHIHNEGESYLHFSNQHSVNKIIDGFSLGFTDYTARLQSSDNISIDIYPGATDINHLIRFNSDGNVGIGTASPQSKLAVNGLPNTPPAGSTTRGIVCITTDGDMWVDDDGDTDICGY